MNPKLLKDGLGWGFLLWLIGYILGIILFAIIPPTLIGYVVMPIGTAITLWVLTKKIPSQKLNYYVLLSMTWTLLAILFDYLFIVKTFNSSSYYKLDVYLYYALTFLLPLIVGWSKASNPKA